MKSLQQRVSLCLLQVLYSRCDLSAQCLENQLGLRPAIRVDFLPNISSRVLAGEVLLYLHSRVGFPLRLRHRSVPLQRLRPQAALHCLRTAAAWQTRCRT